MADSQAENRLENLNLMNDEELKAVLRDLSPGEISETWNYLSEEESSRIFNLIDIEKKVNLIAELPIREQERLITDLSVENIRQILEHMEPDDLVDLIQAVSAEARQSVWSSLSREAKQETLFLLRFDEDDAAGLMTPRYLAVRTGISVGQAINFIRSEAQDVESFYNLYVVDNLKRLKGVLSIRDLLFNDDTIIIDDIMCRDFIYAREDTDQEETARKLEEHNLASLPVLDAHNRLLGIVTFDDIIDVIREEQTEDIYKMGAMEGSSDRYIQTSVWRLIRKRVPWLTILLIAGTLTTNVLSYYNKLILGAAFLIWFVPVITQTGGNSGTQSSTLMIRGLARNEVSFRDIGKVILKEIAVGILMGCILCLVIILRGILLPPGITFEQAIAIGFALIFVVLFSSLIGILAPLIINRMGFDPTVMAGPLMATVIDVVGLTIYFEISRLILGI